VRRSSQAFVAIGSNLDDPLRQVEAAFEALAQIEETRLEARSALYRSAPMGPPDQPDYVNAVAALSTRLGPAALLRALQAIEAVRGRRRDGPKWGPRNLDLDLLLHGDAVISTPLLTLPHPGLTARNFVVYPLADVAPGLVLPDGQRLTELRAQLGDEGLRRLGCGEASA
jgi:2-amino-4-hydroxy-6-hydroxymethyldihydropteridine diphosphokinase